MTADQLLMRMHEEGERPHGFTIKWEPCYTLGSELVTRQVKTLRKRGHVDIMGMTGNRIAVNLTDAGREAAEARIRTRK